MQPSLAVMSLVLLAPLCLIIGLLIKVTSPGPMLYRGLRVGKNGRIFTIYKFRTLAVGTEESISARLLTDWDAHYTCIGKFLKRTKLDALPQLVNVLKGDMHLVGLRPIRPIFLEKTLRPYPSLPDPFCHKVGDGRFSVSARRLCTAAQQLLSQGSSISRTRIPHARERLLAYLKGG
jgi:hypothetical protein